MDIAGTQDIPTDWVSPSSERQEHRSPRHRPPRPKPDPSQCGLTPRVSCPGAVRHDGVKHAERPHPCGRPSRVDDAPTRIGTLQMERRCTNRSVKGRPGEGPYPVL